MKQKECPKCKIKYNFFNYEEALSFFTKDSTKKDGLDCLCKKCRKTYRQQNKEKELERWKLYYTPGSDARKRHIIRSQTRRKFGSAKKYNCSRCNNKADEWHHIEYKTDSVIPLCVKCHESCTPGDI